MSKGRRLRVTGFKSKYTLLPLELREEIEAKVREGGVTAKELWSFVHSRKPDADLSYSAMRYHLRCLRADLSRRRDFERASGLLGDKLVEGTDGILGPLIAETIRVVALELLARERDAQGGPEQKGQASAPVERPEPSELMVLATTLQRLASAKKLTVEAQPRRKAEPAERKADEPEKLPKRGLSHESAEAIRRALLGQDQQQPAKDNPETDGGEEKE